MEKFYQSMDFRSSGSRIASAPRNQPTCNRTPAPTNRRSTPIKPHEGQDRSPLTFIAPPVVNQRPSFCETRTRRNPAPPRPREHPRPSPSSETRPCRSGSRYDRRLSQHSYLRNIISDPDFGRLNQNQNTAHTRSMISSASLRDSPTSSARRRRSSRPGLRPSPETESVCHPFGPFARVKS